MSMRALKLGLSKASLLAEPKGNELLYHLRLVPEGNHTDVANLEMKEIMDTDDCKIYRGNQLITITSTQELEKLMRLATFKTMEMVEVRTEDSVYYAAVDGDLLKKEYVGVLTDSLSRVVAFVQSIKGTFWANDGKRLIQLEDNIQENFMHLKPQDCIRYINKNHNMFKNKPDEIVLFK
ncbi:hypothetical protein [Lysinibacillus xylanilyticus]|uniref:hypothetical protein n=1 Tax=Lysinibacillus xylanilyticus TaxID=582475 RepID=UPI0036DE53D1